MGLFGMLEDDSVAALPMPKLPELSMSERMLMEKETTGIYISGHPMDDYRQALKGTRVVPMGKLLDEDSGYSDDQVVTVAGVVQSVKSKTTRNNSLMAYVTVEDDTGSMEMLAFSNALNQYGVYLKENQAVVITGRLSQRDDKEPQIVINRARPITDFLREMPEPQPAAQPAPKTVNAGTLYLRLPSENGPLYPRIRAMLNMFPGESQAVLYFADTGVRRGTRFGFDELLLNELKNVLGEANVVIK